MNFLLTLIPGMIVALCRKQSFKHATLNIMFTAYLTATLYYVTNISTIHDVWTGAVGPLVLLPFNSQGIDTYLWNIALFIPLGFMLPMLNQASRKWDITLACGFFFSLTIEIFQLFNSRITDIDDLITNTLGTLIGYLIFKGLSSESDDNSERTSFFEQFTIMVICILSVFFLKSV